MKTNIRKLLCLLAAAAVILSGVFAATVQAAQPAAEADNFMNMVIFVRFSGETEDAFNAGNNFSAIYNMYNRTQSGGVDYSFKNYIKTISDGKLRVNCYMPQASADNLSVTPFSVSGAREDYSDEYDIITEVISAINNGQIIVDFAANKPDFTSAGYLDNLTLIVQGKASARDDYLTPHKYAYTGQAKITRQASGGQTDIGIYNYNLIDSDSLVDTSGSAAHIGNKQGVISHEFMHTLGLPDLYRNSGSGTPVGIWSIMASTSPYQQYPLSYSRHKLNWIESDSTDETSPGVFTLNKASAGEGSRLLLISTPLSESEFFAVEYRKKLTGTQASVGFETKIPESGLIIYRVNDSIEGKSNIAGNNYIYVFRPGVTDMDSADETDTNGLNLIWNAAVNPDNNEVSYGSTDLNAPFTDNTIYYSNGDNSGIRLYDIAYSPDGESISFKIEYGDYSTLGLWDDNASPGYGSDVAIAADGAGNVFAAWANDNNEVKVSRYSSSLWSDAGSFSDCFSPKLICYKDEIYLICAKGSAAYQCAVYKYTDGAFARLWQDTASASSIVGFAASDNSLYAAYVKDSGGRLVIKNALTGEVIDESLTGVYLSNPALAADEGAIYAVYSDIFSSTDNKAKVKKFNLAEGSWSLLKQFDLSSTNTHCCSVSNGKIYVLAANSSLSLCGVYNNGSWEDMPSPSFLENCFNTQLFTVGNTSYISYFNGSDKRAALMRLNSTIWERVGGNIAGAVASLNLCYARGCFWAVCSTEQTGEVFVRSKEIAVGAQSIAINTPDNSRVLELGSSMQLSAEITPLNADNREVIWSVENTMGEAAITEGGLLTALKAGNVTVKATASDGSGVFGEKVIEVINWSGQGDETSPYIITNAEQLDLVRTQLSAHYRLEGDIVFTAEDFAEGGDYYNGGKGWIPIGTLNEPFTGTLDGGSHGISGLTINSVDTVQSAAGLFGYISDCTIENLLISDMKISAGEYLTYAGGIAGSSQGNASTIVNCANTSDFSLKAMYAGGIIGHGGEADISRCYNAGAITAMNSGDTFYMGGITGVSFGGSITDCFNTGSITEGDLTVNCYMGSIAGQLTDATAANCYNTAPVNGKNSISSKAHILIGRTTGSTQVNNCYSLREPFSYITDEQTLTREQMLINSNFIGFDFDNVWTMEGNPTYSLPELADNPLRGNHITQIEITSPSERIDTSSQPLRLSATVTPQNADNKTLSWGIVGGNNRATLDKTGLFTPLKAGEVEVYAIADDTNVIYATKTVTIHEHHPGVTHIAVVTENGESELLVGDTMQLLAEVTPNEAEKAV
ncbi:MAG: hypothetical protein GX061_01090, partial [Eubacteriaceae bacterium]|nr:hypothetical protein [Eubacteriaceae bacterium]